MKKWILIPIIVSFVLITVATTVLLIVYKDAIFTENTFMLILSIVLGVFFLTGGIIAWRLSR